MRLASGTSKSAVLRDVNPIPSPGALNFEVVFIESPNSWNRALSSRSTLPLLAHCAKPRKAKSAVSGAEGDFKLPREHVHRGTRLARSEP
jgi:hypothetical protein